MTKIRGFMLILLISLVCCTSNVTNQIPVESKNGGHVQEPVRDVRVREYLIGDAIGVVALTDRYDKDDFIHIYNEDGSLWYKFTFYDNEAVRQTNDDFKPFSFHQDYFVLALKCVGKSEGRFEVVVNEETGMKKYVRVNDPVLKFQTWEEHILQVFAVDFNRKDNPILEKPGGQVKSIDFSKGITFRPVEMKGEWLKVQWNGTEKTEGKNRDDNFGWIKWKKNGFLAIELFYFS